MNKIVIYDYKSGKDEQHTLSVEIRDNGDLVFDGYDCGQSVKDWFGDFDFEYWTTIENHNVPKFLLNLIKEHFKSISEIKEWLKKKEIPFDATSF